MASITIDTKRLRQVETMLVEMGAKLEDLSVPLLFGAKRARNDTLADFDSAGSMAGDPWAPLAESTRKRDKYRDHKNTTRPTSSHRPLDLSGRYYGSIRYMVDKFAAGVTLGPAYWLHFMGTVSPDGGPKNPPRAAGYISDETVELTADEILSYALETSGKG